MNTSLVRNALLANSIFSIASGFLLILFPRYLSSILGAAHQGMMIILGAGLICFGAMLIYLAISERINGWQVLSATIADLMWVIGSLIVLIISPDSLENTGQWLISTIALVVLSFALAQLRGLHHLYLNQENGLYRYCLVIFSPVSANKMWNIVSQLGNISRYSNMLKHSRLVGGGEARVGAVRHCQDNRGRKWSEEVINLNAGSSFTLKFDSEQSDFPFPFTKMYGGWDIKPSEDGSEIMVWWECQPKIKWLGPIIMPLLAMGLDKEFVNVIKLMTADVQGCAIRQIKGVQFLPRLC